MATNLLDPGELRLLWGEAKRQPDLEDSESPSLVPRPCPPPRPKAQELVSGTSDRGGKCCATTDWMRVCLRDSYTQSTLTTLHCR